MFEMPPVSLRCFCAAAGLLQLDQQETGGEIPI